MGAPRLSLILLAAAATSLLCGCRGTASSRPPIHLNPNMDNQKRCDPQEENDFFKDKRAMRPDVPGTVPVSTGPTDDVYLTGKQGDKFSEALPHDLTLDTAFLQRGQARYDIYCAPCHDVSGSGKGSVIQRAAAGGTTWQPPSFHDDRLRSLPVGQIFDLISHGVRTMPAYAAQVPVQDRWAIAAYVRALQRSQIATFQQVPEAVASQHGWTAPPPAPAADEAPAAATAPPGDGRHGKGRKPRNR